MTKKSLLSLFEKPISGEWGKAPNENSDTNVGVIRTTNFSKDIRIKPKSEIVLRDIDTKKISLKKLRYGDIIIEKSGGSPTQPVGRVIFYDLKDDDTRVCNNFTAILRAKDGNDSKYLAYLLYYLYSKRVVSKFQNKTTGIINLKLTNYLKYTEVKIPPLPTQKKIVKVLDKSQSLIDARKEQIRLLDELTQSIFYDMFGDPVTNPKGWELSSVQKVCNKIVGGGTPSKAKAEYYIGNIPWVTPKDMKVIEIIDSKDHINEKAIQNSSTNLVKAGSLLMVIRSGILKRHLPVAINIKNVTINQDMKAFTVKESILDINYFLYYWIMSERYVLTKVRAFTADNIEFNQIKNMHIPLPPIELQNEFAQKVKIIKYQKEHMQQSLKQLENSFNSLIKKAYNGELF